MTTSTSFCNHQKLKRVNTELNDGGFVVYQCEKCHQWCRTTSPFVASHEEISTSTLKNDFEWLESLGRGRYGAVNKYRNKKDGQSYAIKITNETDLNEDEFKVLSDLQHENIVRYYACWSETYDSAFQKL